jgi:tRNA A-37 threonylcarbamoyl transferase component Bud32
VCFPFIASHGFFSGSESEQGLVGAEIGRLHATFREYSNQPESRNLLSTLRANGATIPNSIGVTRAEFLEIASRAAVAPQDEATEEVRAHADAAMRALELLESLAPHAAKVSEPVTQLIHRDLHPHNVLNLGTRGAILDFDDVALGSAYNDLGYALHAFVRQGCHHYGSSQAAAMTSAFLTGYCSTNPELPIDGPTIVFHALNECFKRGMKALRERYVDGSMRLHTSFIRKHMRFPGEILFIAEQGGLLNC